MYNNGFMVDDKWYTNNCNQNRHAMSISHVFDAAGATVHARTENGYQTLQTVCVGFRKVSRNTVSSWAWCMCLSEILPIDKIVPMRHPRANIRMTGANATAARSTTGRSGTCVSKFVQYRPAVDTNNHSGDADGAEDGVIQSL